MPFPQTNHCLLPYLESCEGFYSGHKTVWGIIIIINIA